MIPDADDDPFPHAIKVDRLFIEEQDFVADDTSPLSPYEMADLDEPAVPVDLPPLHPGEDPDPPAEKMGGRAGPRDEIAVSRDMKSADEQVTLAFFKKGKTKVRRPWDGPDLSPEKSTDTKKRNNNLLPFFASLPRFLRQLQLTIAGTPAAPVCQNHSDLRQRGKEDRPEGILLRDGKRYRTAIAPVQDP